MPDSREEILLRELEKLRREDFYYIDKTGLIRDLLNNWGEVNLFTRPRRFGKTLNMSMLKSFFEIGADKTLFDGLLISQEMALCEAYMETDYTTLTQDDFQQTVNDYLAYLVKTGIVYED